MNFALFTCAFLAFASIYRPDMPTDERNTMPGAIWRGAGGDYRISCAFTGICQLESNLKVRKWYPEVRQNLDAAGAHNDLLCRELYREGRITDSPFWTRSKQWKRWFKKFQAHPDLGTETAARAFTYGVKKYGFDMEVQRWKCQPGSVPGLLRLMDVYARQREMMTMCRQQ